jgi:hypothetical protein
MSVDDYGPVDGDHREQARRAGVAGLRARNRELNREVADLRARLDAYETPGGSAAADPAADPSFAEAEEPSADPAEPVTAELVGAEREARQAAEAALAAARAEPVGVSAETRRAMELDQAASAGAISPPVGLDGLLARARDRSVPYEQLQQEWKAHGFTDQGGSWDDFTR